MLKLNKQKLQQTALHKGIDRDLAAAAVPQRAERSTSTATFGEAHGVLQGDAQDDDEPRHGASVPGGSRVELCRSDDASDSSTGRDLVTTSMGRRKVSGREACGQDLQGSLR